MLQNRIFDLSDIGLFESIKKDDLRSFEEIYKRYWSKLYFYTFNILHDSNISKDIVQEIFIDLWKKREHLIIDNFQAYIYKAAKFQIYKHYRDNKFKKYLDDEFENFLSNHNVEEDFEYAELKNRVDSQISNLPEKRRVIFELSRRQGLTNKEIAKKLNISVQTVKNQITLAIKTIRDALKYVVLFIFF